MIRTFLIVLAILIVPVIVDEITGSDADTLFESWIVGIIKSLVVGGTIFLIFTLIDNLIK